MNREDEALLALVVLAYRENLERAADPDEDITKYEKYLTDEERQVMEAGRPKLLKRILEELGLS